MIATVAVLRGQRAKPLFKVVGDFAQGVLMRMWIMTLTEMLASFYLKINESSTNTRFSSAFVTELLNEGYKKICQFRNIPWNWLIDTAKMTCVYTTVATSSTSTTLNVTSHTNIFDDQWLMVTDDDIYERVKVDDSSIDGSVTLDSDFPLVNTWAADNYVLSGQLELPSDFRSAISLRAEDLESDSQDIVTLTKVSKREFDVVYNWKNSSGTPTYYYIDSSHLYIYPLPDDNWNIWMDYIIMPSDLSAGSDTPAMPTMYHQMLVGFAVANALLSDTRAMNQAASGQAKYYLDKFHRDLSEMAADHNNQWNEFRSMTVSSDKDLPQFKW